MLEKPSFHPFSLENTADYLCWREQKLALLAELDSIVVPVAAVGLDNKALRAMQRCLLACNMVVYHLAGTIQHEDKGVMRQLAAQLGMQQLDTNICADEDSITSLRVVESGRHAGYIPYSNKPLSWHTDGYYNLPQHQIHGMALHCVQPAAEGGENALLDHELLYIHLRDHSPDTISALMHAEAMTIPPNNEQGELHREAQSGPVFSVNPQDGTLHMRFSARKRNIIWREDPATQRAVQMINEFLASDSEWIIRHTMQAGQGLICNNVLHNRTGFSDDAKQPRLIYRGRFYDRAAHTSPHDLMRYMNANM